MWPVWCRLSWLYMHLNHCVVVSNWSTVQGSIHEHIDRIRNCFTILRKCQKKMWFFCLWNSFHYRFRALLELVIGLDMLKILCITFISDGVVDYWIPQHFIIFNFRYDNFSYLPLFGGYEAFLLDYVESVISYLNALLQPTVRIWKWCRAPIEPPFIKDKYFNVYIWVWMYKK